MRFYSNGSTANSYNHYVEIEVYGYSNSITSVTLNKTAENLILGETDTLTATVAAVVTNNTVEWTSSDDSVATVDNTGKVTALKEGTATITATDCRQEQDCKLLCNCKQ